jgi:hypothetical protein
MADLHRPARPPAGVGGPRSSSSSMAIRATGRPCRATMPSASAA